MASCKVLQDIPLRAQLRPLTGFPFQDIRLTMIRGKGMKYLGEFQKSECESRRQRIPCFLGDVLLKCGVFRRFGLMSSKFRSVL